MDPLETLWITSFYCVIMTSAVVPNVVAPCKKCIALDMQKYEDFLQ
jgi:hypothetical protein